MKNSHALNWPQSSFLIESGRATRKSRDWPGINLTIAT
jgi:hypothetical protein